MTEIAFERYNSCRFAEGSHGRRQADAALLLEGALAGDRKDTNKFMEMLTTSDLPVALTPALNRRIVSGYTAYDKFWNQIASREIVDDFRLQEIQKYTHTQGGIPQDNGGQTFVPGTLPRVGEGDEYPVIAVSGTGINFRIGKSGEQFALSWERIVSDRSLNELERALNRFALDAARTEDVEATRNFIANTSGVGVTNALPVANLLGGTGTQELTRANLEAAYSQSLTAKVDGRSIGSAGGRVLIVPPSQVEKATRLVAGVETSFTEDGVTYTGPNSLAGKFSVVENEWMEALDATNGDSSWVVAPKPGSLGDAEGISVAFLRGHETPEMSVKSSDRFTVDGSRVPGTEGDFDHDSFATRVRHTATGVVKSFAGFVAADGSA